MPIVGENNDALGDFLEEIIEKLEELVAARPELSVNVPKQEPPVVNVNVPAQEPPVVNISPRGAWKFKVTRNKEGFIDEVIVTPKS